MSQGEMKLKSNIIEQLGFKKVCLQCKVEASKVIDGKLRNFNCYNCGAAYDELGFDNPMLCKKMIYAEFQGKGYTLSEKDVELVYVDCKSKKHIPFGTALNLILLSRQGKLSEMIS